VGEAAAPSAAIGGYRTAQTYLFQPADSESRAEQITGGGSYDPDVYGPHYDYVDFQSGWAWTNPGGDWIDAAKVAQGSTDWGSVATATGSVGVVYDHTITVTAAVKEAMRGNGWQAFLISPSAAPRTIATPFYATTARRPKIDVTYTDGTTAVLACRVMAQSASGAGTVNSTQTEMALPVFAEFEKPTNDVSVATLAFSITEQNWAGSPTHVKVTGILNPLIGGEDGGLGLADQSSAFDVGLTSVSGIIGQHLITDSTVIGDILVESALSRSSESNFDPAIWGGSSDTSKFPHTVHGKWFKGPSGQSYDTPTIVQSTYTGEGFTPLATGLGAMRVVMPAVAVVPGQEVTNGGRVASDMVIMLPESMFGNTDRLFVRYYVRMGTPYSITPDSRPQVLSNGSPRWTDLAGKTGIMPSHTTSYGGVSGTSGGGYGWQMRQSWLDCDTGVSGPSVGGVTQGFHLYDYQSNNPLGYRYGSEQSIQYERWGQQGGQGGVMYAGYWYCVETEVKLNAVNIGAGTYSTDGELRAWVDGRLVYERTGMVFRTAPLHAPAYDGSQIRPARTLGVKELWFNWYHGGQSENTVDRTLFISNLAWGTSYIGPMKPAAPSWQPATSVSSVIGYAQGAHPLGLKATLEEISPSHMSWAVTPGSDQPWNLPGGTKTIGSITPWAGVAYDKVNQRIYSMGTGHLSVCIPTLYYYDIVTRAFAWAEQPLPSDGLSDINPDAPSVANTGAAYPSHQWDPVESVWLGGSSAWPTALKQPGTIQPEVQHSQYALVWIPGSAAGNTNGIILNCCQPTGYQGGSVDLNQRAYFDLDTGRWKLARNFRITSPIGYYAGGAVWFGGGVKRAFAQMMPSTNGNSFLQNFDPHTRTWVSTTATAASDVLYGCGGLIAHEDSGLLLAIIPTNSSGTPRPATNTGDPPTQFRIRAVDAATAAAGSHTWAWLSTPNAGTWPLANIDEGGGVFRQTFEALGGAYVPRNRCIYIHDWRYNSTTLWKITPSCAAGSSAATYLAATWTVSQETFAPGLLNQSDSGATVGGNYPYNRMVWHDESRSFIGLPMYYTQRTWAVRPAGV